MVVDGSWDNAGVPVARRRGMPLWGKILAGCGIAFVLMLGSCVGLVVWGVNRVTSAADRAWEPVAQVIQELRTEEGGRRVYRAHPDLADRFPTEEAFQEARLGWQERLETFPARRPQLKDLFRDGSSHGWNLEASSQDGREVMRVRMKLKRGESLVVEVEGDRVVDVRVDD